MRIITKPEFAAAAIGSMIGLATIIIML